MTKIHNLFKEILKTKEDNFKLKMLIFIFWLNIDKYKIAVCGYVSKKKREFHTVYLEMLLWANDLIIKI